MAKSRVPWVRLAGFGLAIAYAQPVLAEEADALILQPAETGNGRDSTFSEGPSAPHQKLTLGVNYTGGQLRWNFSPRWAMEGRYQQGKAPSDYGTVTSRVFGLRAYRFFHATSRFPLYGGSEMAMVNAKPALSNYRTQGFAIGAFGGVEYRVTTRLFVDADLGPYVISLKEKQTRLSGTNLDFVLNTALLWRIF